MKRIDIRFNQKEINLIKDMIGSTLVKYKCDPFEFSTAVYGIVGIFTDKSSYAFTNAIQVMDYYGTDEDVAVFRLEERIGSEIKSLISENTMIELPINKTIKEIDIINEHQKVFECNKQTYDVWLTRGIIFILEDGTEVSLEKNIWFSEMITVDRGENLLNKFAPVDEFSEDWEGNFRGECSRDIVKYL
jgi:hypothetical protein